MYQKQTLNPFHCPGRKNILFILIKHHSKDKQKQFDQYFV